MYSSFNAASSTPQFAHGGEEAIILAQSIFSPEKVL